MIVSGSRRGRVRLLACVALAHCCASGCGATCAQIAAKRVELDRRAPSTDPWHVAIILPFTLIDRLVADRLGEVPTLRVELPRLGPLSLKEPLTLVAKRCVVRPAPVDAIGYLVEFDVRYGGEAAFSLSMEGVARPEIDVGKGTLEVSLRPDQLSSVTPRLSPAASRRLADIFQRRMPRLVSAVVPRGLVDGAAQAAVSYLGAQAFRLLRGQLSRVKEITRLRLGLHGLPIARLGLVSLGAPQSQHDGALRLQVGTSLPVAHGLRLPAADASKPGPARALIAGDAAVELGNWAMAHGHVPSRLSRDLKLGKDGEFELALRWLSGRRPVKVHAWKSASPCAHARLGAAPAISIKDGKLEIGAQYAVLEELDGAAIVKVAAWFRSLWSRTYSFSRQVAARTDVALAGRKLQIAVDRASLDGDTFVLELRLTDLPPASAPARPRETPLKSRVTLLDHR